MGRVDGSSGACGPGRLCAAAVVWLAGSAPCRAAEDVQSDSDEW